MAEVRLTSYVELITKNMKRWNGDKVESCVKIARNSDMWSGKSVAVRACVCVYLCGARVYAFETNTFSSPYINTPDQLSMPS